MSEPTNVSLQGIINWARTPSAKGANPANQDINADKLDGMHASELKIQGDVEGTLSAANVSKLQGRNISDTAPSENQALVWNGNAWTPAAITVISRIYPNMPTNPQDGDIWFV